jgi:plasmid stability protein
MTTLTIDVPADIYERLRAAAAQQGKPIEVVAQEWLAEQSTQARTDLPPPAPPGERERAIAVLRNAGLLAESGPELKARAARSRLTLEEARAILDRAGGKPLSEVILEMRGPKE